jgi:hypothetical protein
MKVDRAGTVHKTAGFHGRSPRIPWVLAVSSAKVNPETTAVKGLEGAAVRLPADVEHANARRFRSYDDFEEIELHSTSLIDKEGRVYRARFGGDPFTDFPPEYPARISNLGMTTFARFNLRGGTKRLMSSR